MIPRSANDPFCSNCGYTLVGLTESSKCPECGKPLVEVVSRGSSFPNLGKRYRSKATLFGLPVIDIAVGPKNGELRGKARGIIAIGDSALGFIAVGGIARGIIALGGLALGVFSIGGLSVGLVIAIGGMAVGGIASGGFAAGMLAVGGLAIGAVTQGGLAIGYCARGGQASGTHVITFANADPIATAMFERFEWFFGSWPPGALGPWKPILTLIVPTIVVALMIGIVVAWAMHNEPDET